MKYIMHKDSMDVAIEVIYFDGSAYKIRFINLGYTGKPWFCSNIVTLPSDRLNLKNYVTLSNQDLITVRTKPGLPI